MNVVVESFLSISFKKIDMVKVASESECTPNQLDHWFAIRIAHPWIFGFIKKSNLSNDKSENKIERFALEEKVDSIILSIDSKTRSLNLSIKELEIRDEKEALNKYGSSASGASLGDILGSVLKK